jgi:hypothetical protein
MLIYFFSFSFQMFRHRQPTSLLAMAAKASAFHFMGQSQCPAKDLLFYIKLAGGMKTFDKEDYEKIVLKLEVLQQDETTPRAVKKELKIMTLNVMAYKHHEVSLRALGLHNFPCWIYPENFFYYRRFNENNWNLEIPVFSAEMNRLLPRRQDVILAEEEVPCSIFDFWVHRPEEDFFKLLGSLVMALKMDRLHEALSYAADVLSRDAFVGHPSTFHVWGLVGCVLAKLARPPAMIKSCLIKMKRLSNWRLESERLHCLTYEMMCAAFVGSDTEGHFFRQIETALPTTSLLYRDVVLIHVEFHMKKIEDILLVAQVFDDLLEPSYPPSHVTDQAQLQVDHLFQFLHGITGTSDIDVSGHYATVQLLDLCLQQIKDVDFRRKRKRLQETDTCNDFFIDLLDNDLQMVRYLLEMETVQREAEGDAHRTNTLEWADVAVTHGLFMSCLYGNDNKKMKYFQQARDVYARSTTGHHHRIPILDQALIAKHLSDAETEFINTDFETLPNYDVKFEWLLFVDPFLKSMTRFGEASAQRHYD